MKQEILHIPLPEFLQHWLGKPYLPIYGYGLMLVIGFLLGAQLAKYLARRFGLDGDTFINACLLGLVAGVVGSRLSHVLESLAAHNQEFADNGKSVWENFKGMLNVSSGGLTFYGGFLLATPVMIWFAIRKHVPLLRGMDIIAPCLMIGLAFGRVGCYLNGCCYGEESTVSWGAAFPYGSNAFVEQYYKGEIKLPAEFTDPDPDHAVERGAAEPGHTVVNFDPKLPRLLTKEELRKKGLLDEAEKRTANRVQPTELYSTFNSFLVAAVLLGFFTLRPLPGRIFALMLILEGLSRYLLEMLRVEPVVWGKMSFSMVIGLGLVLAGMAMWWACGFGKDRGENRALAGTPAAA